MKPTVRLFLSAAVAVGWSVLSPAENRYWKGGSGSWHDPAMWTGWSGSGVPASGDYVVFDYGSATGPHDVTFEGIDAAVGTVSVGETPAGETPFSKTVYFRGEGATLELARNQSFHVMTNRKAVIDNLRITYEAESYPRMYGKLSLVNGAQMVLRDGDGGVYFYPGGAGSRLLVDNSTFFLRVITPSGDGGEVVVRHNGRMAWLRSWASQAAWAKMAFDFTTGEILTSTWTPFYNHSMLPKRAGGTLVHRNDGCQLETSGDTLVRLGGTAFFTNTYTAAFGFTNSVAIYGRGRLLAGRMTVPAASTNWYDLSEVSVNGPLNDGGDSSRMTFFGDTLFTPVLERPNRYTWWSNGHCWFIGGTKTFDMLERFGRSDTKRSLSNINRFHSNCRSKTVFLNLNETTRSTVYLGISGDTYGALELGENVPILFGQTDDFWLAPAFDGLKMGPGSSIQTAGSQANYIKVFGEVELDATARIIRQTSDRGAGGEPYALLSSYDDDATEPVFEFTTEAAGWSVHRVGGSFFYTDGNYVIPAAYEQTACWTGNEDGSWSNPKNWGKGTVPVDRTTYLTGYRNTEISVDAENAVCFKLRSEYNCGRQPGPFILRGLPLTWSDEGQVDHIVVSGMYPLVFENDVTFFGADEFWVCGRGDVNPAPVVLRGKTRVEYGTFSPEGQVVVQGGTVTAKDLRFRNWSVASTSYWPTKLRLEKGGVVEITDQTSVNSATGSFFIAKGCRVGVTGDWKSTGVRNEHCVRGTLDISGALGGDATQAFYGEGVVTVAALDGSEGASVRIGEGLTLVTTAGGTTTMPVVQSQGDALFAPRRDITLAGGLRMDAHGRTLAVSNDCAVNVTGPLAGHDFDLLKTGSGRLAFAAIPDFRDGYVTVSGGTLALADSVAVGRLAVARGATLELVADADGKLPLLTVHDDLDLTDFTLKATGDAIPDDWQTVLAVAEDLAITGTPNSKLFTRIVTNEDDTMELQVRPKRGFVFFFR